MNFQKKKKKSISVPDCLIKANVADPDEMPYSVAMSGISSGSTLFAKVPIYCVTLKKGL